jgi:serpin B
MRLLILILLIVTGFTACKQKATFKLSESPKELIFKDSGKDYDINAQVLGFNKFGFDLFQKISAKDTINPIISPYSINRLLLMTFAGTSGETEEEMSAFLNWDNSIGFHKLADQIERTLKEQQNDRYSIVVANKMFVNNGISIFDGYQNSLKTYYQTEVEAIDFNNNKAAAAKINNWVFENTDSVIKNICSPNDFKQNTKLALINAVAFKGGWMHVFDKNQTYRNIFHGVVSDVETDFMFRFWKKFDPYDKKYTEDKYKSELEKKYAPFLYNEDEYLRVMEFPYSDGEASMFIILPKLKNKNDDSRDPKSYYNWTEIEPYFQFDSIVNMMNNMDSIHGKMFVAIPKFKSSYQFNVKDKLIEMGLSSPFSGNADFSRISPESLVINKITHKASIEVDEYGTTASAASLAFVATKSLNFDVVEFYAIVPFYYIIRDKKTGLILFIGKYTQVTNN